MVVITNQQWLRCKSRLFTYVVEATAMKKQLSLLNTIVLGYHIQA